ncbi:SMP-30/gluconolactonase/LRE family protein [Rhodopirellula sp. MGV]|uniref:SMP-30/gluconolactonase/LRE family protein n=1 Tax=Rhodopirellula sp. MGV TaxID=2023130 RepID=UPI000B96DAC1|nr:SMP-30/gluconolactonase/LRE family protein [Rhodopirellula sp. MGV]OYP38931.1 gluconolactonase [Rhodopirellula sp. MGV]PNY37608.1 SMP-30/gluconolactonase/LRE family protein [Rhodopirellula baltica]
MRLTKRWVAAACLQALLMASAGANVAFAQETESQQSIQPTGKVELIKDGYTFTEGPAWEPESKTLFFSDIPNTSIHRVMPDGTVELFTDQSKHTNGILIAADGKIRACQMDGQVVEYEITTGEATPIAGKFGGRRFNAPNDLIVDSQGGIYFTDPLFSAPTPLPQTIQAVYYIAPSEDEEPRVSRVTSDIKAPNGIGLSPDGGKLYVCPSGQAEMLVYDVLGPGKLSPAKTFCHVKQPEGKSNSGADGITLDVKGNVYVTTDLGVQIFSPDGEFLGLVEFPQIPANVCFGGDDWKTMYVTARTGVYRVPMPIAGLH